MSRSRSSLLVRPRERERHEATTSEPAATAIDTVMRPDSAVRRARRSTVKATLWLVFHVVGLVPRAPARWLMRHAGRVAWLLDRGNRRRALANVARAFPSGAPEWLERVARESYVQIGPSSVDCYDFHRRSAVTIGRFVEECESVARLDEAVKSGRGVLVVSAHLGNFMLLTPYLALRLASQGRKVHIVTGTPGIPAVARAVGTVFAGHGGVWLRRGGAFRLAEQALREGQVVVILMDQDSTRVHHATFVPFFGELARTTTGPAVLARLTGAVMLPMALVRTVGGYRLLARSPVATQRTGRDAEDDWATTRSATEALQALIEEYPEQWLWLHHRWRQRPPEGWQAPDGRIVD